MNSYQQKDGRNKIAIKQIITEIESISQKKGYWAITKQRLIEILHIKPYEFKAHIYKIYKKMNMPIDTEIFNNNNVADLITLLESICGDIVESEFERSGIFLTYNTRIEINECLLNYINNEITNHNINKEDFEAMLLGTDTFAEAIEIYYNEEFNIDSILEKVKELFIKDKDYRVIKLVRRNVKDYLNSLFYRNIFTKEKIFDGLENRLRKFALNKKLYKQQQREKENNYRNYKQNQRNYNYKSSNNYNNNNYNNKSEKAKKIMGIIGEIDIEKLKIIYKKLMKIYHPDINPQGLKKTQEINYAYSILAEELKK